MTYFRFKTFTPSYYFPTLQAHQQYMYGLYSAYGGKLSKIYWTLFKKCSIVRVLTAVNEEQLPFPHRQIKEADGTDCLMAFNMGSPGVEQKISILGYDNSNNTPFFAKFSQKPVAKVLTYNEIEIYRLLKDSSLTPQLLDYKICPEYVYLKAEFVEGKRPETTELTMPIVELCLQLKEHHLTAAHIDDYGLKLALAHGDFCPWNILMQENHMKLIDWELAKDRPLGFDLFTYICQVSLLFAPDIELLQAIDRHNTLIEHYFAACDIDCYLPYLKAFATEKALYEEGKGNHTAYTQYHLLANILS